MERVRSYSVSPVTPTRTSVPHTPKKEVTDNHPRTSNSGSRAFKANMWILRNAKCRLWTATTTCQGDENTNKEEKGSGGFGK